MGSLCGGYGGGEGLLDAGADPDCRDDWLPALQLAAQRGHPRVVNLLLERGAHPNVSRSGGGSWPLVIAVSHGQTGCVRALLRHGANPNSRDESGLSVLAIARKLANAQKHASSEVVRLLGAAGARELRTRAP